LSVKGIFDFYIKDLVGGWEMTSRMLMVGLALAVGSMLSNIIPDPVVYEQKNIELVQSW